MQPEQARFLAEFFLPLIEQEWKCTKRVIAAIPEEKKDYRPEAKARSAIEIAWHIAATDMWFLEGIIEGEFKMEESRQPAEIQNVADVIAWYEKTIPPMLERLRGLPAEKLAKPISFFGMNDYSAVVYLNFSIAHTIHHRGQLSTYLRPMGSKVPAIYGGSADEPFEAPRQA